MILVSFSACNIGIKTQSKVIYVSLGKAMTHKGLVRIATDKPIKVTVDNVHTKLKCGGYYVISKSDLQKLLDIARESENGKEK
jgi:hypothetical protein